MDLKFYVLRVEKRISSKTNKPYYVCNVLEDRSQQVQKNVFINEDLFDEWDGRNYIEASEYFYFAPTIVDNKLYFEIKCDTRALENEEDL